MSVVRAAPSDGPGALLAVTRPGTREVVGEVAVTAPDELAALVQQARVAQTAWAGFAPTQRASVLGRARRALVADRDTLVRTLRAETGKPLEEARFEIDCVAASLAFWAGRAERLLAPSPLPVRSPALLGRRAQQLFRPRGVVGVIGPWNFPLYLSLGDAVPALAAGNAVVLKPSEITPLTVLRAVEVLRGVGFPPGLLQAAVGAGEVGAALVEHVDHVHFTGSAGTGRKVAHAAVDRSIPYTLELGGKDAMLVLEDADLDRAANAAVAYGLLNAGQACLSVERLYVVDAVHDAFVDRLVNAVARCRASAVPDGGAATVEVGPLVSAAQAALVRAHIDDAVARGATVRLGGGVQGDLVEPTVLTGVTQEMRCVQEETFGPTLPVVRVRDEDEAVALANDSRYGLAASVWTRDRARGRAVAARLRVGTVSVNDAFTHCFAFELPMGGLRESGVGARHGTEGIRKFCERTVVVGSPLYAPARDLFWMPYRETRSRVLDLVGRVVYGR